MGLNIHPYPDIFSNLFLLYIPLKLTLAFRHDLYFAEVRILWLIPIPIPNSPQ